MIDRAALDCRNSGANAQTYVGPISRTSGLRVVQGLTNRGGSIGANRWIAG
jgi:hypothetical protein